MKKIVYFIIFIFLVIGIDCKEIKTKYGVTFELSEECIFDSNTNFKEDQWDNYYYEFRFKEYDYEIDMTKYDSKYLITEYGEDYYNKVKNNIENNDEFERFPPGEPIIFIKNDKANGINYQSVYLTGFYDYDGMIGLRLIFFKDTIPFSISIYHYCDEPRFFNGKLYEEDKNNLRLRVNSIIDSYEKKIDKKDKNRASTLALNQISDEINLIIEGKKANNLFPEQLIYLFTVYNKIVSTLNFSEPTIKYKTKVCNTILRENQSINGKMINKIEKNKVLKLISFGKYDFVDKIDGIWVKVETEKGEIGWCFDAYLGEIKE